MTRVTSSLLAVAILGVGVGISEAADPMSDEAAKPSIDERVTNDTVKGTLVRVDGENYWVQDYDGKEIRLYVDADTKQDQIIMKGDKIIANVTDTGHATTLQRDE